MHPLNQKFDKIYCINLLSRPDRREKFRKRMLELGIDFEFFDTITYGFNRSFLQLHKQYGHDFVYPGELGCCYSHYSIIKLARDAGLKNVFIFEDDTVFLDNFNTEVEWYINNLPDDFDLFYLYLMMFKWPQLDYKLITKYDKFIYRPKEAHCASAYGINAKMFDKIIDSMDNNLRIIDSYYRIIQDDPQYNIYACYPNLTSQDYDRSNIRGDGKTTPQLNYFTNVVTFGDYQISNYK